MAQLSPSPRLYFTDSVTGLPLVGGKLYTYASGTTTPQATYTTAAGNAANTNPIILNARGEAEIWLDATKQYTYVLKTATDTLVWTVNNINGNSTTAPVNVLDFGAVADSTGGATGTNNAAAFQAAFDTGHDVFIPAADTPGYGYRVTTATIKYPVRVYGEGVTATTIFPTTGYSTFVSANDSVEISDLQFLGKTGTGQAEVYGDCIKYDAVTNDATFTGFMEGCKVQRVKFRNLKMNGINVAQLLRESHIRECRFVGMGNLATDRSPIYMKQVLGGSGNNQNVLWIDKNMFYRFDNKAINMVRSTLISPLYSDSSYDAIEITNNLVHGQLQDENGVEPVQPAPCHHISIDDGSRVIVRGNFLTAIHPQYCGVYLGNGGTACKSIQVQGNTMSVKEVVGGVTYNRATGNATGNFVNAIGVENVDISGNSVYGGVYNNDFAVNNGDYTTPIDCNIRGNLTEAGTILVDISGIGSYTGVIESNNTTTITNAITTFGTVTTGGAISTTGSITATTTISGKNGLSEAFGSSAAYSLWLKYNAASNGVLIGSPAANQFQVLSNGGTPLVTVNSTSEFKPGNDNLMSCGTAANRWSVVYAGTGAINTSDERYKTLIGPIDAAVLRAWGKVNFVSHKFKDAVALKGDAARWHFGVLAQEVKAAFDSEGLDPFAYGILCYDEWPETTEDVSEWVNGELIVTGHRVIPAGNRYGVRYDQALVLECAYLRSKIS